MHKHATLIDDLGGATLVAKALGVKAARVGNWRHRGVAWRWRGDLATLAATRGVTVPAGFVVAALTAAGGRHGPGPGPA